MPSSGRRPDPKIAALIRKRVPKARQTFDHVRQTAEAEIQQVAEVGQVGRVFGGKDEKPSNVVTVVIIGFVILLGVTLGGIIWAELLAKPSEALQKIFLSLLAAIGTMVGFLYGKRDA